MLKMLTEHIAGSMMPNPQQALKIKCLKLRCFLKLMVALTCASIIAAEYFLIRVMFRYLSDSLGLSDNAASLLISLFFCLQALALFSYLTYKLKSIESLYENHSSIKKIASAFVDGFKGMS